MPPVIEILEQPGWLHFRVSGENTRENVAAYLVAIRRECEQRHRPAALVEENLHGPSLSITTVFELISEGAKNVWPVVRRIAFVDVNPEHKAERMAFAENVAVNRGVNVRVFATLAEAEAWMTGAAATG